MQGGMVQYSEQFLRRRKMLLILPLLLAPMCALAFYGLGGGKGSGGRRTGLEGKGLNMTLPEAQFKTKGKPVDKAGFYKQADEDSVRKAESRRMDPYSVHVGDSASVGGRSLAGSGAAGLSGLTPSSRSDKQADELLQKLDLLKSVLHRQDSGKIAGLPGYGPPVTYGTDSRPSYKAPELYERPGLSGGLPVTRATAGPGDPDLDRLNGMLDKILKIQHPSEVSTDTMVMPHGNPLVGTLSGRHREEVVRTLDGSDTSGERILPGLGSGVENGEQDLGAGFMELGAVSGNDSLAQGAVAAMVARDQTLVSGATVELRLDQDADINGVLVRRGSPVWGKAVLSGERLRVSVTSIWVGQTFLPVSLEVYDLDGMEGIRARGSMDRDVAKESGEEAVGSLGVTSMDPSLAGQATAAGIQAARSLIVRKVRMVRVSLDAGHRVFLRNVKIANH